MNRNGSALATLEASIAEKARLEQERRDRLWKEQALERKQQQRIQNGKESFSVFQRTMLNEGVRRGADVFAAGFARVHVREPSSLALVRPAGADAVFPWPALVHVRWSRRRCRDERRVHEAPADDHATQRKPRADARRVGCFSPRDACGGLAACWSALAACCHASAAATSSTGAEIHRASHAKRPAARAPRRARAMTASPAPPSNGAPSARAAVGIATSVTLPAALSKLISRAPCVNCCAPRASATRPRAEPRRLELLASRALGAARPAAPSFLGVGVRDQSSSSSGRLAGGMARMTASAVSAAGAAVATGASSAPAARARRGTRAPRRRLDKFRFTGAAARRSRTRGSRASRRAGRTEKCGHCAGRRITIAAGVRRVREERAKEKSVVDMPQVDAVAVLERGERARGPRRFWPLNESACAPSSNQPVVVGAAAARSPPPPPSVSEASQT